MSRAQEPQKPFLVFGNPFRLISPKGSHLSSKLLSLLNTFEEKLAARIRNLKPAVRADILQLSWMRLAMVSLIEIQSDVINLITALEMPVSEWDDKWIDVYLDNSVKLLDICNAFTSEISHLKHGHLFLRCASRYLVGDSEKQLRACSSLDAWKNHMSKKNPRIDECFVIMDSMVQMLDLPKVKNSAKGKVLMQALYGVKVFTISVCNIFASAFSGSTKKLMELQVSSTYLWAYEFSDLQAFLNMEIRNSNSNSNGSATIIKEMQVVDASVKKIYPISKGETELADSDKLQGLVSDLATSSENLSQGLQVLGDEVDRFFRVVLTGRDTLLSSLPSDGGWPEKVGVIKIGSPMKR